MQVQIAHPLHKVIETTVNFFGAASEEKTDPAELEGAGNVLEGIDLAMEMYHEYMSFAVGPLSDDEEFQIMLEKYAEARTAITEHLNWVGDGEGWPTVPFGDLGDEVPFSMWSYVNGIGASNFWSWLSGTICNEFHLSIKPTYWDTQLELGPVKFWSEPEIELLDIVVMDFALPPTDPSPIRGVYTMFDAPEEAMGTVLNGADGMKEVMADAAIYTESELPGAIVAAQVPAWADMILSHRSGRYSNSTTPGAMGMDMTTLGNAGSSDEGLGDTPVGDVQEYKDALKELCKQQFTEMYRQGMEVSLRCSLILQTEGSSLEDNNVTAGTTVRVKPDATFWEQFFGGGGPLLDFYATEVVHRVDCQAPAAYTTIRGSFMRESGGPANVEAITSGVAPNYLYEG
jgi:hypothetical protein